MMKILFLISLIFFWNLPILWAQKIPGKMEVRLTKKTLKEDKIDIYLIEPKGTKYNVFQIKSKTDKSLLHSISSKDFIKLIEELYRPSYQSLSIERFEIDSTQLILNAEKNLVYCLANTQQWSAKQRQYVLRELKTISNYNDALSHIIQYENKVTNRSVQTHISLALMYGKDTVKWYSNPLGSVYHIPWQAEGKGKSYNQGISLALQNIFKKNISFTEPKIDKEMMIKRMVRDIFESKCRKELYEISPEQFTKELAELKPHFEVKHLVEHGVRGVYIENVAQVFQATLHNKLMVNNVLIQYFISRQGNTLYSRDSLIKEYKTLISRAQKIGFLMNYLSEHASRSLNIYYFDNKAVNDFWINKFNTNPEQWAAFDLELREIQASDPEEEQEQPLSIDDTSLKRIKKQYCGCGFRYEKAFMDKAILLELINEYGNKSIWFLFPDNSLILFQFEGNVCFKYKAADLGSDGKGLQDACIKFDKQGNIVR